MHRTEVDRPRERWYQGLALALCLLFIACSGPGSSAPPGDTISWEQLPIGLGRGYLVAGLDEQAAVQGVLQQGDLAPNFQLQLEDGRQLSLHDLQGNPVLSNFWATWCGPCRSEMPDLVAAAKQYPELRVLAVNVQEELATIEPFAADLQMEIPIVCDRDGTLRDLYAVGGMPTSIFIDKKGKIAVIWPGQLNQELLEEFLNEIE